MPQAAEPLVLAGDDRAELARWSRGSSPMLAERARGDLGIDRARVSNGRARLAPGRWEGLAEERGPGRPPSILLDRVEEVITATLEELPQNATHWSRSSMAARSGLSPSTIGRIW